MDSLPDFVKLAEAYGHVGIRLERPEDVEVALRKAFIDAANDPEFHAAVEKFGASVDLVDGETVQKMAAEIMSTPPELVAKTKELLKP